MSLTEGSRHGPFEVLALLGFGGVGEAYLACDTDLDRDVVIQLLPGALAGDARRRERLRRVVDAVIALAHPHLGRIHGLDTSLLPPVLVTARPEGDTLAEILESDLGPRFGFDAARALSMAERVACALEALHGCGVVHGQLRPAAVTLGPDGHVVVHGFSFSMATMATMASSPAEAGALVSPDIGVDRAAYLSPERVRGGAPGVASDIWAFGVLLYETLSGVRPFLGEQASDACAAILAAEPEWSALPIETPRVARQLLKSCLQKDPAGRPSNVATIRRELEPYQPPDRAQRLADSATRLAQSTVDRPEHSEAAAEPVGAHQGLAVGLDVADASDEARATPFRAGARRGAARAASRFALAVALLVGAAAGGFGLLTLRTAPEASPSAYVLSAPPSRPVSVSDATQDDLAISPDGTVIVYAALVDGRRQLYRRSVARLEGAVLPDLPSPQTIFFSPDGRRIGFADGDFAWFTADVAGTSARRLTEQRAPARGATWGPDGSIILAEERSGLFRVPAAGGTRELLTSPDRSRGEAGHYWPQFLPDGRAVLFTIVGDGGERTRVAVLDLKSGTIRRLLPSGRNPQYVDPGFVVYSAAGSLYGIGFDPDRLELHGYPMALLSGVVTKSSGSADFRLSRSGSLVYAPGRLRGTPPRTLVWVDRAGREEPIPAEPRGYSRARVEPDGHRLSLEVREPQSARLVWDLDRRLLEPAMPLRLSGSPAAVAEPLATSGFMSMGAPASVGTGGAAVAVGRTGRAEPAAMSPDRRWVAYVSDESGRPELYVRAQPGTDAEPVRITTGGGRHPVWSPAGDALFYVSSDGAMMAIEIETAPTFSAGDPTELFRGPYVLDSDARSFDVAPEGDRFLVIKRDDPIPPPRFDVVIVEGWAGEVARRLSRHCPPRSGGLWKDRTASRGGASRGGR